MMLPVAVTRPEIAVIVLKRRCRSFGSLISIFVIQR